MKKALSAALALVMILLMASCLSAPALAGGKLPAYEIVDEKVYMHQNDDSKEIEVLLNAELKNTGDKPIQLNEGTFTIKDGKGNEIEKADLYFVPDIVKPGETGYVLAYVFPEIKSVDVVADYEIKLIDAEETDEAWQYLAVDSARIDEEDQSAPNHMAPLVIVATHNQTESVPLQMTAVAGAYDADGRLLFVVVNNTDFGLHPGNSGEFSIFPDSTTMAALHDAIQFVNLTDIVKNVKAFVYEGYPWR